QVRGMTIDGLRGLSRPLVVRLGLIALLTTMSLVSVFQRDVVAIAGGTVLGVPPTFVTAAFCLDAAIRRRGRMRVAWSLLGVFMVTYGVADTLWLLHLRTGSETA